MIIKACNKCETIKSIEEFTKNKKSKDGYRNQCQMCYKEYQKEYRLKHKSKNSEYQKEYRLENRESLLEYSRENNKRLSVKKQKREWYLENKDWLEKTEHRRKYRYEYNKKSIKLKWRLFLNNTLKRLGKTKEGHTIDLLGYSANELKIHLELLFTDGMSWDNYGEWHIDHKRPVSSFDDDTPINIVNALTNLQPLWATTREINGVIYEGNLNKGNNTN